MALRSLLALVLLLAAPAAQADGLRRISVLTDPARKNTVVAAYEARDPITPKQAERALNTLASKLMGEHRARAVYLYLYQAEAAPAETRFKGEGDSAAAVSWFRRDAASLGWRYSFTRTDRHKRNDAFVDCATVKFKCHAHQY